MAFFERPLSRRRQGATCPRGHELSGYNAQPRGAGKTCRACQAAFHWARYHNLFNDDPRVKAHADELFSRYQAKDGK